MPKTYPDIGTFTSGQILTATNMTNVATNLNNFRVPPAVRVKRSGDLSYTNNTAIAWNAEDYDTDSMHDNATNNSRITINTAGIYLINFCFYVTFTGTMTNADVQIRKESASTWLSYNTFVMSKSTDFLMSVSAIGSLAVADYVTAQISFGGATSPVVKDDNRTWFAATWMGQSA